MKKQIFNTTLSALLLFTGVTMYGNETAPAATEVATTSAPSKISTYYAKAKALGSKHKVALALTAAAGIGLYAALKYPAIRAFLGFEDEQEKENKFVY